MLPDTGRLPNQIETLATRTLVTRFGMLQPVPATVDLKTEYSQAEIARLLGSILHATGNIRCPVVHFVSAYEGEGGGGIAFEVALSAAQQAGKRTLFLNMNTTAEGSYQSLAQKSVISIEAFWGAEDPQASPLVALFGSTLYYADFSRSAGGISAAVNVDLLRILLTELRESFDFIVIFSEGAIARGYSAALSALSDGAILVVEAERTRTPVVEQLKEQTEAARGRIIGTVLNRRRYYIPRWIYRLLFGGSRQ